MEIITAALAPEIIEVEDDSTDRESEDEDPASHSKGLTMFWKAGHSSFRCTWCQFIAFAKASSTSTYSFALS